MKAPPSQQYCCDIDNWSNTLGCLILSIPSSPIVLQISVKLKKVELSVRQLQLSMSSYFYECLKRVNVCPKLTLTHTLYNMLLPTIKNIYPTTL